MNNRTESAPVSWNYSEHAAHYDKRADYSEEGVRQLLSAMHCNAGDTVADIGAGTAKLTKLLVRYGLRVLAVEPNAAMREFGIRNTAGADVQWSVGTGESTGVADSSVSAAFFGSSFNVVEPAAALAEIRRIVSPFGWFACMWNHRELADPTQTSIEAIIREQIPGYDYGSRRADPRSTIEASEYFHPPQMMETSFAVPMSREAIVEAWRSHATLRRQAESADRFEAIVLSIEELVSRLPEPISVPYVTRMYFAQLKR